MSAASAVFPAVTGVGPYVLTERLGKGGMGAVYKATRRETGQVVAVKILKPELAENSVLVGRFVQEFRAAARLDHPNIVRALDAGIDGAFAYLVMEFVEGRCLGRMLVRGNKLPEAAAIRLIAQVAQALDYAHRNRVIHRDVKPDNVMVRPDGLAKLADFGLAKDFDGNEELTRSCAALGTPHFMSPEQYANAKKAGVVSDVYSLGASLYNMVTGRLPFGTAPTIQALAQKVKGEVKPPRELVPELSVETDRAIRRAMSPDPGKRPANCLQFIKLLPGLAPMVQAGGKSGSVKDTGSFPAIAVVHTPAPATTRPDGRERRQSVRRPCRQPTACTIDTDVFPGGTAGNETWPATVYDLSAQGVGLILARRFEPGTVFTIELEGGIRKQPRALTARVVRVQPDSFGHWFHGCTFVS
jgi:serine/threonine protein kinase